MLYIYGRRYDDSVVELIAEFSSGAVALDRDLILIYSDTNLNKHPVLVPYYIPLSGHVGWHRAPVKDTDELSDCYSAFSVSMHGMSSPQ